jgi:hypothetical protein
MIHRANDREGKEREGGGKKERRGVFLDGKRKEEV